MSSVDNRPILGLLLRIKPNNRQPDILLSSLWQRRYNKNKFWKLRKGVNKIGFPKGNFFNPFLALCCLKRHEKKSGKGEQKIYTAAGWILGFDLRKLGLSSGLESGDHLSLVSSPIYPYSLSLSHTHTHTH